MVGESFGGWRRRNRVVVFLMACLFAAGCDPVRTVNQSFTIKVLDRETKAPVNGTTVQLKRPFPSVYPNREFDKKAKKLWEELPWHQGSSDSDGRVVINIVVTAIDGSWGSKPPPKRDISGRKYLVKITPFNGSSEEQEIQLISNAAGETETFLVEIVEIGPVKYEQPWQAVIGVVMTVMIVVFIWGCFRIRRLDPAWTIEIQRVIWTLQCRAPTPRNWISTKLDEPTCNEDK